MSCRRARRSHVGCGLLSGRISAARRDFTYVRRMSRPPTSDPEGGQLSAPDWAWILTLQVTSEVGICPAPARARKSSAEARARSRRHRPGRIERVEKARMSRRRLPARRSLPRRTRRERHRRGARSTVCVNFTTPWTTCCRICERAITALRARWSGDPLGERPARPTAPRPSPPPVSSRSAVSTIVVAASAVPCQARLLAADGDREPPGLDHALPVRPDERAAPARRA